MFQCSVIKMRYVYHALSNVEHYSPQLAAVLMFVNSAGSCMLLWAAAWRARAPSEGEYTIPSGIGKRLCSDPGLCDLSWLHVAAPDLHWRPSPDIEDWRLLMQKPLLIQRIKLRAVWNKLDGWITVLTSSVSSVLSSIF